MRHPLSAGTVAFLALRSRHRFLQTRRYPLLGTHRDVRFHATLPQCKISIEVRRVDRPSHAIFIVAHVSVRHGDVFNVGIDKVLVPGHRIGNTVDIIPASGVESNKVLTKGGAYFHQLVGGLQLLDKYVHQYRPRWKGQVTFECFNEFVPHRCLPGRLDLWKV